MAINYPTSLDNFTNPTSSSPINNPSHADQHANANDAIEALEAKVGVTGSTVSTSHDYRIAQVESLVTSAVAGAKSIYQDVRNQSGSSLSKATPVYVSGSEGASGKMLISAASNAVESTSSKTMGITTSAIANNSNGQVISEGILEGIDTTGAADGDPVWLGTNGAKIYGLANKPSSPSHLVFLGVVIRGGQANTGSMYVKIQNGFELEELHNVQISSLINGNIIAYDSTAGRWKNTNTLQSTSSTVPLVIKGSNSQTANLQEWQNSSGTVLANVRPDGTIATPYLDNPAASGAYIQLSSAAGIDIVSRVTGQTTFRVIGTSSQTANLQEWQDSNGTTLSRVGSGGDFYSNAMFGYYLRAGTQSFVDSTSLRVHSYGSAPNVVIKNTVGTYDLTQWQNSSGTVLANVNASGYFTSAGLSSGGGSGTTDINATAGNLTVRGSSAFSANASVLVGTGYAGGIGVIVKGYASQTANLQEWQNSSGTVLTRIDSYGAIRTAAAVDFNNTSTGSTTAIIRVNYPATTPLYVAGTSSQTANLTEWANSAGTVLARVDKDGFIYSSLFSSAGNLNAGYQIIGGRAIAQLDGSAVMGMVNWNASYHTLQLRNASSQTADSLRIENSSGTVLAKVDASGNITTAGGLFVGDTNLLGYTWAYFSRNGSTGLVTWNQQNYAGASLMILAGNAASQGLIVKGATSQSANLQEWQNSSGSVLTQITPNGSILINDAALRINVPSSYGSIRLQIGTDNTGVIGQVIRGVSGQTANLQEWQDSSGSILASVSANGTFTSYGSNLGAFQSTGTSAGGYNGLRLTNNVGQNYLLGTAGASESVFSVANSFYIYDGIAGVMRLRLNSSGLVGINAIPTAQLHISNSTASNVGLIVNTPTSPTANIQEWQINGVTKAYVNTTGSFITVDSITASGSVVSTNGVYANTGYIGAEISAKPFLTTIVGAIIRGAVSQTADLQQWQNSSGTVLTSIASDGHYIFPYNVWNRSAGDSQRRFYFSAYAQTFYEAGSGGHEFRRYDSTAHFKIGDNGNLSTTLLDASSIGLIIKGAASQTANLQEWQNSSGTVLASVLSGGAIAAPNFFAGYIASTMISAIASGPLNSGIIVRGAASQTANLQEWQNSSGTALVSIQSDGSFKFSDSLSGPGVFYWGGANIGGFGGGAGLGNTWNFTPYNSARIAVIVRGASSQTANLQEWQNSAGTALTYINSSGIIVSSAGAYLQTSNSYGIQSTAGAATTVPIIVQGASSQTANLQQWQDSSLTIKVKIDAYGQLTSGSGLYATGGGGFGAAVVAQPGAATLPAIIAKGYTSQSANLQEWQNSSGNIMAKVDSGGNIVLTNASVAATGGNITTTYGLYSNLSATTNAGVAVKPWAADITGAIVRGYASQTANLQEWQNSAGTVLTKINSSGDIDTSGIVGAQYAAFGANRSYVDGVALRILTNGSNIGLIVKGWSGTTANLQEWQDSSGNTQAFVRYDGFINTNSSLRVAGDNISAYRFQGVSDGNYTMNFPGSGNIQLFSAVNDTGSGVGVLGIKNATTAPTSNPTTGGILYVSSGALIYRGSGGAITTIARSGNESSTISANTATTVDTVALSSFTTIEYVVSIKQGSKIRSSKFLVHTDGTSVDSTEYGIMEMGGGITGIIVTASVSGTDSILQVTITDAATTNATVKLIKTML